MNFLTGNERDQLKLQHRRERDGRIRDRIKAVLLYNEGWTPKDIARVLLISDEAVRNHIDEYKVSKKLKPESGGSAEKLSADQSQKLEAHLQIHTYLYVKDIVAYVEVTFGVFYTVHGMRNWLQRHCFSYKKPAVVPGKPTRLSNKNGWLNTRSFVRNFPTMKPSVLLTAFIQPTVCNRHMGGSKKECARRSQQIQDGLDSIFLAASTSSRA